MLRNNSVRRREIHPLSMAVPVASRGRAGGGHPGRTTFWARRAGGGVLGPCVVQPGAHATGAAASTVLLSCWPGTSRCAAGTAAGAGAGPRRVTSHTMVERYGCRALLHTINGPGWRRCGPPSVTVPRGMDKLLRCCVFVLVVWWSPSVRGAQPRLQLRWPTAGPIGQSEGRTGRPRFAVQAVGELATFHERRPSDMSAHVGRNPPGLSSCPRRAGPSCGPTLLCFLISDCLFSFSHSAASSFQRK